MVFALSHSNKGKGNTEFASAYYDLTNSSVRIYDNSEIVHLIIIGN